MRITLKLFCMGILFFALPDLAIGDDVKVCVLKLQPELLLADGKKKGTEENSGVNDQNCKAGLCADEIYFSVSSYLNGSLLEAGRVPRAGLKERDVIPVNIKPENAKGNFQIWRGAIKKGQVAEMNVLAMEQDNESLKFISIATDALFKTVNIENIGGNKKLDVKIIDGLGFSVNIGSLDFAGFAKNLSALISGRSGGHDRIAEFRLFIKRDDDGSLKFKFVPADGMVAIKQEEGFKTPGEEFLAVGKGDTKDQDSDFTYRIKLAVFDNSEANFKGCREVTAKTPPLAAVD